LRKRSLYSSDCCFSAHWPIVCTGYRYRTLHSSDFQSLPAVLPPGSAHCCRWMEHATNDERGSSEPSAAQPASAVDNINNDHDDNDTIKRNVSEPNSDHTTTSSISDIHDTNGNTNGTAHSHLDINTKQSRKDRPISGVVPPYWRHQRALSRASLASSVDTHRSSKPAITLEDHTADPNATTTRGLWARSVTIDDHVVVSGKTGIGAYVVWMCNVQTLDVRPNHSHSSRMVHMLMVPYRAAQ
jgi:hypothetical protein